MQKKSENIPLINRRIKQLRVSKGISQTQLAKYLGVTKTYISMIENGARNPGEQLLRSLHNILSADYEWLSSEHYTEMDAVLEAGGHTNLVNQFDGRRLESTPVGTMRNLESVDISMILWVLVRYGDFDFPELARRLALSQDCLNDLIAGDDSDCVYQKFKRKVHERALKLLGELKNCEAVFKTMTSTIALLKSEYEYQQFESLREIMKTLLEEEDVNAEEGNVLFEANVPGLACGFKLYNEAEHRVWHCYVCKSASNFKRNDGYRRVAETVITQTKLHSEKDTVVWITTDRTVFSNMLMAAESLKDSLADALPEYAVAYLGDTARNSTMLPCFK